MFEYVVTGFDCDGAGYEESWTEYEGTNREKALAAKRRGEKRNCGGYISIKMIKGKKQEDKYAFLDEILRENNMYYYDD